MSGVLLKPSFRVSEYVAVTGSRYVAIEMDEFQTTVLIDKPQARRLAKSLTRVAAQGRVTASGEGGLSPSEKSKPAPALLKDTP